MSILLDLNCEIAGVRLHNPLVLASGILGTHATLLERCALSGAGAVTAKSCGPEFRRGHPNPTVIDWGPGLLNAVGLPNPGAEAEVPILLDARARLKHLETPLIASIFADTVANFGNVAQIVCQAQPDLLEVNISCPNVGNEFGLPFAGSMESAAAVTDAVKRVATCPVIIKLAPNVPDIAHIAQAVVAAGADAICAVNTMPGMAIDIYTGRPILANHVGGISGPALKAIAVRAIFEITAAVNVPVIGTGGVNSGLDAAELLMAGATAVGVGTAVYYRGVEVFRQIQLELIEFMRNQGYTSLDQIRGIAMVNLTPHSWNVWPATLPRRARIVDIIPENYRTSSLVLDLHLQAQPGQFIMAWIPGLDEKPFSLADATPVTLTVARVGPFSSALHALVPGDYLGIRGPFGQGFKPQGQHALLAGGGYGVAPLAYLAEALIKAGSDIRVVIGARTAADLLLIERFNRLGIVPQLTTEDGSRGVPGRIITVAAPLLQSGAVDQLYACGPHGMLEALEYLASETGVPAQLSWEGYMRCGVGLCGSCEHRGKLLCLDGPVLPGSPS